MVTHFGPISYYQEKRSFTKKNKEIDALTTALDGDTTSKNKKVIRMSLLT
jgi:hypothetical protein